jgi:hypothetical protein
MPECMYLYRYIHMYIYIYIYIYLNDSYILNFRLHIAPIRDESGKVNLIVSVQYEVHYCTYIYIYIYIYI